MGSEEKALFFKIAECSETHRVRFFCQQCDRLFCGDCFTLSHRRENREHEVEEIGERLERENMQVGRQMEELSRLAENAKTAANTRDQYVNELIEALASLITEVERLLMVSEITREAQQLRQINRDCIALFQRVEGSRRSMDQKNDSVISLKSRLAINDYLKQQLQETNQTLNEHVNEDLDHENRNSDPASAVIKSVIKLLGKEKIKGKRQLY